jgi:hypothetical protein
MEINPESFSLNKTHIVAGIAIFATTVLWATLFGMTGIGINDLLTFKLQFLAEKVLTLNTLLFFLTFSMPIAIAAALAKRTEKITLVITSMFASLAALIIIMALFSQLQSLWIAAVFYIISLPLAIETASTRYEELKRRVTARASWSTAGKMVSITSIGLFVMTMAAIVPEHEAYLEKFEDFAQDMARDFLSENSPEKLGEGLGSSLAGMLVQRDIAAADSLMENPAFQKLREKQDLEVQLFVAAVEAQKTRLESPEYKEEIEQQIEVQLTPLVSDSTGQALESIDIVESMREMLPVIKVLEKIMPLGIWIGLMLALAITGIFSFVAMLLSKTTAVAYALIVEKAISLGENRGGGKRLVRKEQAGKKPEIPSKKGPAINN